MKRSRSLPKNVFTGLNERIKKQEQSKKVTYRMKYKGRLSLNKSEVSRGHTRKDLRNLAKDMTHDEDKDEKLRLYDCLPVTEGGEGQERREEEKERRKKGRREGKEGDERVELWRRLKDVLHDRRRNANNLVVTREHAVTLVAHNEDYAFGNVLWLILRAQFSGNCIGDDDGARKQNVIVNSLRDKSFPVIDRLLSFSFPPSPPLDPFDPSPQFLAHLATCRTNAKDILKEWDSFESLFPHSRALLSTFPQAASVIPRVYVLTAFVNTLDDLLGKVESLGVLVGCDPSFWPSPLSSSPNLPLSNEANTALSEYVRRSLTRKGMTKVFKRVSSLCDNSVNKAVLLLQVPPKTYAQAAKRSVPGKEGWESSWGIYSETGVNMHVPSPLPILICIEKIRLILMERWLQERTEADDAHDDTLTMESLIEDSRDCLEQAISMRKAAIEKLELTCCTIPTRDKFEGVVMEVFEKYLRYIRMWVLAYSREERDEMTLISRLEDEFTSARSISLAIPSASTNLCLSFLTSAMDIFRRTAIDEWQRDIANINEEAATYDLGDEDEDGLCDEFQGLDDPSILHTCRMYNSLLRKVQDRTSRVLALIRRLVDYCTNACLFQLNVPLDVLSRQLAHFVMVESESSPIAKHSILVDCEVVDGGEVDKLLSALSEGRTIEGRGRVVVVPSLPFWHGRSTRVKGGLAERLRYVLRVVPDNNILITGTEPLGRVEGLVKPSSSRVSSHELINERLNDFSKEIVELLETLHTFVAHLSNTYQFSELSTHQVAPFRFTMMRAFDLCMQVHREIGRLLVPSLHPSFALSSVSLVSDWRRFLEDSHPHPCTSIPLWAVPALTFLHTVAVHPSFTRLLSHEDFKKLKEDVLACEDLIMGGEGGEGGGYELIEGVHSPRPRRSTREEGENRDERMRMAVASIDKMIDFRMRKALPLGRVGTMKKEEYEVKNLIPPYRRAVSFKWRLLEKIGSGGFGTVHKAVREDGKGLLAVKIIKAERNLHVVVEEVAVMRDLHHDNVVSYYGAEVRGNELLILMEYCSEGTLESICSERMDTRLVRRFTHSLLSAVDFIHHNHMVHRDIKPANIFLSRSSVLKLGDFGCARRLKETKTIEGELNKTAGTVNYMAPEVITGGGKGEQGEYKGHGRAVDIWSIGCVVAQMLTGHIPWEGVNYFHIVLRVGKGEKPNCGDAADARIVREFTDACFQFDPLKRPTAEELLKTPFANVVDSSLDLDSP